MYTDVIMDMLGNQRMRQLITDYYQSSGEPNLVNRAVQQAWTRERKFSQDLMDGNEGEGTSFWGQIKCVVFFLLFRLLFSSLPCLFLVFVGLHQSFVFIFLLAVVSLLSIMGLQNKLSTLLDV